jgi:hypothetical protein
LPETTGIGIHHPRFGYFLRASSSGISSSSSRGTFDNRKRQRGDGEE